MAFFPLILDTSNGNQLKELPSGEDLDLDGSGLLNLSSLSLTGGLTAGSASTTGNISVGGNTTITGTIAVTGTGTFTGAITTADINSSGTIDAQSITINGEALSASQVQSDWNETDNTDPAFILNKPNIPQEINDLTNVDTGSPPNNSVLTYINGVWEASPTGSGINVDDLSVQVVTSANAGGANLQYDNDPLSPNAGRFLYTQPNIPTLTSAFENDGDGEQTGSFVTLATIQAESYITIDEVQVNSPITRDTTTLPGSVIIGFDETNYLRAVQSDGNFSGDGTVASPLALASSLNLGGITVNDASTFNNTVEVLGLTYGAGGISSTNGAITTTNGNITATNGNVTGNNIIATNEVQASSFTAGASAITFNSTNRVDIVNGHFYIAPNATLPASPAAGSIAIGNEGLNVYVQDVDGNGNPGWQYLGGVGAARGIIFPSKTTAERNAISGPIIGETIYNVDNSRLEVYNGSNWVAVV